MSYNNIRRIMSIALILAFATTHTMAIAEMDYGNSYSTMVISGKVNLTDVNNKITLSLRDSDVKQVLRMFADKAGMNIVFHDSVKGKVTLDLVQTPINDAFALVLQIAGLSYYKQGNTMIILDKTSPDNANFSKQEMMIFPINYVSAAKIAEFLNKNVFGIKRAGISGVDAATVNASTNELIVFGMPNDVAVVEKVIAQFDREPFSKTFIVNHTTPAEMASMVCDMLTPAMGGSGSGSGVMPSPSNAGTSVGKMTGGAASTSDSSSESSSDSSGSTMKIGEGVIACAISSDISATNLAPFQAKDLTITYFPQRGTISMMGGSEAQAAMIEKFIKRNDIKQPQAFLEVSIVELNEAGSKEFQNEWHFTSRNFNFSFDGTSTSGGRGSGIYNNLSEVTMYGEKLPKFDENGNQIGWTEPSWVEHVSGSNSPHIAWFMKYLIENHKGRVLANPKILITNGQESIIDLTEDYVEKVTSEFLTSTQTSSGSAGTVQKNYTISDDLGIKVTLTPFISPDGYVTLNIKPDYSTVAEEIREIGVTGSHDLVATLLSRRNLDLKNVRIKDGETLVLGGLIQENEQKTVHKIPLLGDLPIIGAAFRSSSTSKSKSELIIMITPRILNDDETIAGDL